MRTRIVIRGPGGAKLEYWLDGPAQVEIASHPTWPLKGQEVVVWTFQDGETGVKHRLLGQDEQTVLRDRERAGRSEG